MAKGDKSTKEGESQPRRDDNRTPFERFRDLTKHLIRVRKDKTQ